MSATSSWVTVVPVSRRCVAAHVHALPLPLSRHPSSPVSPSHAVVACAVVVPCHPASHVVACDAVAASCAGVVVVPSFHRGTC